MPEETTTIDYLLNLIRPDAECYIITHLPNENKHTFPRSYSELKEIQIVVIP